MSKRFKKAALQAAAFLSAGMILLPLSACGHEEKPAESSDASSSVPSGMLPFQNISSIRITDTKEGRYQDPIDFFLTEKEIEVYKRGRNSKAHKAPKNTDPVTYHKSTGFEALWGYLYVSGQMERLEQLWDYIRTLKEK